jgi:hypothetical protein
MSNFDSSVNETRYDIYDEDRVTNREKTKGRTRGKRRYFPSNVPQSFICNAVTGIAYPHRVGSKEQSLYYKIVDTTGTCDANGCIIRRFTDTMDDEGNVTKTRSNLPNPNTNHLFFDSPEQCMTHLNVTIPPADIERWKESRHVSI